MTLGEVLAKLSQQSIHDTIYAAEPWTEDSEAIVARGPDAGGLPKEASETGLKYFLEVSIARDLVEDWVASLDDQPTPPIICQRVIDYAIDDA